MEFVRSGMVVGLGTGSTADFFLAALADALKTGRLTDVVGVPTSNQSERRARQLGIPLVPLGHPNLPEVTVDGADEVGPDLNLIKGLGGALLREKVVATNSRQMVVIADAGKVVPVLGTKSPLPVEVAKFGHETHVPFLRGLGCDPTLRLVGGEPYTTDNGNYIYDCRFPRVDDPAALEQKLLGRAGVVETGLFLGIASVALIADERDVRRVTRM